MTKYVSGEEHQRMVSSSTPLSKPSKSIPLNSKYLAAVVVLIVVAIISFFGGDQYGKHHTSTSSSASSLASRSGGFSGGAGGGGGFDRADRVVGTVSAISASSISIDNSQTNATVTLAITSTTQISDNGQTASASDIQTGDTVFATEDPSNTSNALRIIVNPSFGGFGGGSGSSSDQSQTQSNTDAITD